MMAAELGLVLMIVAVAFGTAALTLIWAAHLSARRVLQHSAATLIAESDAPIAYLFDDQSLVDATPAARAFLEKSTAEGTDWARLATLLRHRFPGLDKAVGRLADLGRIDLTAKGDEDDRLCAEWRDGLARIVLSDAGAIDGGGDAARAEWQGHAAAEAELTTLRTIVRAGPTIVWKTDAEGAVIWANDGYFALVEEVLGAEEAYSWPPPTLFDVAPGGLAETTATPARTSLQPADGGAPLWFECHGYAHEGETLCFATPADGLVRAENTLREFVQTLSKTFAQLPIGLAIFDRARKLALFNPALTDLTALEVEFLAARPTLFAFLDRLREQRRIPEPRNYSSWRQRMVDLETAASNGFVQEDWTLPTGQTFRVTGRPHPDGAVAFLFEDISAEVSLTRRFRSEIELGQTVIDSLDEAIAVFSSSGVITFSNAAYTALWGIDPSATLAETGILDATRLWQSRSTPNPIWGDARDYLSEHGERVEWSGLIALKDGRHLQCRFQPLSGGATLVGFLETTAIPAGNNLAEPRPEKAKRGASRKTTKASA